MFRIRDRAHTESRFEARPPRPLGLSLTATAVLALAAVPAPASAAARLPVPVPLPLPLPLPLPDSAGDQLTITYADGSGPTVTSTLSCHPAGGTHRNARAACDRLDALDGPLGPVPHDQMCTELYGGPQTARITGTWRGRHVEDTYTRTDGCQAARWQRMEPVLPEPGRPPRTPAP
ncbi:SSI family serine proteinase inhibitor [Streptantibioticus ferralitis]|uniref:SSI family serine proteinase inhibitor n=1 Tax=Streptantibioticus ferralitis TaxID=236510 RepID=A0ABT5Z0J7_9ACTN|nr:SSI family serine proteinase inhibitor [Streptantibioticus ferralitis]MDF2257366.1 SSI family serine proteinase inhibitor [Streptantibioticus ferralitis]